MSCVIITPRMLKGKVTPPPSKSAAHRAIICASMSNGVSKIEPFETSNDMRATIGAVKALGAKVSLSENCLTVNGRDTFRTNCREIDCLESGSTLRFIIPVASLTDSEIIFTGKGRLPERPIGPYLDCLPKSGVICETKGGLPLKTKGKLKSGEFSLPGNISSQFITGLLLALPALTDDSIIKLTTPLESAGYVDLSISVMKQFGISVECREQSYFVKGSQKYTSCNFITEADWSQAAFWLAAGALGADITCDGIETGSKQGDKAILDILKRLGAKVTGTRVCPGALSGCEIDASQIPDLVPPIAAVAALSRGTTVITGAKRLRIKESDRLSCVTRELNALGARIKETEDGLVIDGVNELKGGEADGCNDHRIVMALSIAAMRSCGKVTINGCECINKSYPKFFEHYNSLGGCADVVNDR